MHVSLVPKQLPNSNSLACQFLFNLSQCLRSLLLTHPLLLPPALTPQLYPPTGRTRQFLHKIQQCPQLQRLVPRVIVGIGFFQEEGPDIHGALLGDADAEAGRKGGLLGADDGDVVVYYDIFPCVFLINAKEIHSIWTHRLPLKYFFQEFRTARKAIHRSNQKLLCVTALLPNDIHSLPTNYRQIPAFEYFRQAHPAHLLPYLLPAFLSSKQRSSHWRKDLISILESTRDRLSWFRMIGRRRESICSQGACLCLCLQASHNGSVLLLDDLIRVVLTILLLRTTAA